MPDKKSLPKKRYDRQRKAREIRRVLAAVTPDNSHPQIQSTLFSMLPAEIRFLIFEFVLCQAYNLAQPIHFHSVNPLYRPGHTHHATFDTSLLLTCRLVYYEAHAIPLRSATHHFQDESYAYNLDVALHHVTKQRGADFYHLHSNVLALRSSEFSMFLLPHIHWRKITWTLCDYLLSLPWRLKLWKPDHLTIILAGLILPASCQEVTLEFETREDLLDVWWKLLEHTRACQHISLSRCDGTILAFDNKYSKQYKWIGSARPRWGTSQTPSAKKTMIYHTVRLCWRAKVARREYTSYDHLDCLRLEGLPEVVEILPLE